MPPASFNWLTGDIFVINELYYFKIVVIWNKIDEKVD